VAQRVREQFDGERQQSRLHFEAMKLRLDKTSPGWRESI
jgi:hypothetical protein